MIFEMRRDFEKYTVGPMGWAEFRPLEWHYFIDDVEVTEKKYKKKLKRAQKEQEKSCT